MNWYDKCAKIKAIVTDIDGTLTNGGIGYGCGSREEVKFFSVRDGSGCHIAQASGLKLCALSGRKSAANTRRLEELHFDLVVEGCLTKADGLQQVCNHFGITPEECMYLGDDLIDLSAFALAGLAVAVADAPEEVRFRADWTTQLPGGQGAVREAVERLLKTLGKWDAVIQAYITKQNF